MFPSSSRGVMMGDSVMTQALCTARIAASGPRFRPSFKDWVH